MSYKKDTKLFSFYVEHTVKCPCGCSTFFKDTTDRVICRWCGNWVYRNEELKLKYEKAKFKRKLERMI